MDILKLKPVFKDYIWGGTRLKTDFGFKSDLDILAEGWMLSCHKDGMNTIDGGEFDGQTLEKVIEKEGKEKLVGTRSLDFPYFPVLIKLIDAKDNLSIQVHPDNEYAKRVEHEFGKTEIWYVIDATPDAQLVYGFKEKISKEEFKKAIEENPISQSTLDKIDEMDNYVIQHFRIAFGNRIVSHMKKFVPVYVACGGDEVDGVDYFIAKKILRKFEQLNLAYIKDEIDPYINFLDKTFGKNKMKECIEYLLRLKKMA